VNQESKTFRLNQYLARCGVASRRGAEELIRSGAVTVNSRVADHPGFQVDPKQDVVRLKGKAIHPATHTTLILHKPKGIICTRRDRQGRKTVYDLIPSKVQRAGIQTIGRLDFDSSGLLLLTNDGDLHQAMEHPSQRMRRVYQVKARGILERSLVKCLLAGVQLEDGPARAEKVEAVRVSGGISRFSMTLLEGRNREVRRICSAVGLEVLDLKRIQFGPIHLLDLPPGKWRAPMQRESEALERIKTRQTG